MRFNRVFLLILDSVGVGESIDAHSYNDQGANTLGHIRDNYDLFIPNLKKLGFLNTINMDENNSVDAYYTVARPNNPGKDTLNGHYEILGVKNDVQFKTFTENGFPIELVDQIQMITRRKVIGNKNSSGLDIIKELGERQIENGSIILYTSNGSNLQIAAHEASIPVRNLYEYAEKIRQITLREDWKIGRVIACPFTGNNVRTFKFTNERQDYAVKPPTKSVMNYLQENDYSVISIGKVAEIFDYQGISKIIKARTNIDALNKLEDIMDKKFSGLCVVNLNYIFPVPKSEIIKITPASISNERDFDNDIEEFYFAEIEVDFVIAKPLLGHMLLYLNFALFVFDKIGQNYNLFVN